MNKIRLFTHNDLDGVSCIILAQLKFGIKNVDYDICGYNDINEKFEAFIDNREIENYEKVYITDISINQKNAEYINNYLYFNDIVFKLLDHHKTAEYLNKFNWANVIVENKEIKQSGTSLFYKELYGEATIDDNIIFGLKEFVELVRSYDTWDWAKDKNQDAKNLCDIFKMIGSMDFIEYYYKKLSDSLNSIVLFPNKFMTALYYKRQEIDMYIFNKITKTKTFTVCFDKKCIHYAVVLCDRIDCTSELGNAILNNHDGVLNLDLSFVMLVYDDGVALRSKEKFDVGILAQYFGGGGHKNAAGFRIKNPYRFFDIETSKMDKLLETMYHLDGENNE